MSEEATATEAAEEQKGAISAEGEETQDKDAAQYEKDVAAAKEEWEKDKVGPPPGSPRWNSMYWKAKEVDRREEELKENKKDIEAMRRHNEELMALLKEKAQNQEPMKREPEPDVTAVKAQIQDLRKQKAKANAEFDFEKVAELEDKIDDLKESLKKPEKKEDAGAAVTQAMKQKEIDDHFKVWIKDAPWYNPKAPEFDEAMVAYAERIWGRVTKGIADYKEALTAVQEEVEKKFGYKKDKTPQQGSAPKPPNVAGAAGITGRETPPKSQLTEDERRVIRNMFPDDPKGEEKYLAQKIMIAKERGGK